MAKDKDYTPLFLIFWRSYPSRWNSNLSKYVKRKKWPAFEAWEKKSSKIQAKCLRIVKQIKSTEGTPRDCVTWLNERGYDDIDEPDLDAQKLPRKFTDSLKTVQGGVNVNSERNKQRKGLGL